jgi:2-oxoisovalerate dehydrogenase E1 component
VVEIEAPIDGTLSAIDQPVGAVVPMGGRIGGIKKSSPFHLTSQGQA